MLDCSSLLITVLTNKQFMVAWFQGSLYLHY